jgi:hypothetical protein
VTAPNPLGAVGQAASAAASIAHATVFQRDGDAASFPVAGAILLLVLLAIAAWAWAVRRKENRLPWRLALPTRWLSAARSVTGAPVRIVASARLDVGGRAHVVEWGGQQVLIAVNGASAPVVLARRRLDDDARRPAP